MKKTIFTAELWIHRNSNTGKPVAYELFNVSGHQVPMELLIWMNENAGDIEWLKGLPTETLIRAQVEAWYESVNSVDEGYRGWWNTEIKGWLDTEYTFDANREIVTVGRRHDEDDIEELLKQLTVVSDEELEEIFGR